VLKKAPIEEQQGILVGRMPNKRGEKKLEKAPAKTGIN